ncbi:MAG: hypothetical protein JW723_00730 [Bacteroidales bacterium]|nr:hypothetical protein [Bacteroidales bacterium]
MKTKFYLTLVLLTAATIMISCKGKKGDEETKETAQKTTDSIPAVNVYDYSVYGLPVLEDYYDSKSRITFLRVGESVISSGVKKTDTINKKEYSKIVLSDGTTGWSRSDYIIESAVAGAIIAATPVYERPDILTKSTNKKYDDIDIVAVVGEKDGWYNVTGRNNHNSGWIMKEYVSVSKEDVGMAILARKELFDSKGNIMDDRLNDFINNAPYPGSQIVTILRDRLIKSVEMKAMSPPADIEYKVESLPE